MNTASSSYRWVILGLTWFCIFTFAILFQSVPPILGMLVDALQISYAQAGSLMSLFILPSIFLAIPSGLLADRYGTKIMGAAAILTMVLGAAIATQGDTYWTLSLGRLVTGIGAVAILVVMPKIVTSWFRERGLGLSMGIQNTAMPLGTIISLNFMGVIGLQFGWKGPFWIGLAVAALALSLYLLLHRTRNNDRQVAAAPSSLLTSLKEAGSGIWYVGLAWALFNAAIISYFTYAPDYFVTKGKDIFEAGMLASYPMWGSLIILPVVGILIDRIGGKRWFVAIGCIGIAILLYLIPWFTGPAAILPLLISIFVGMAPPGIFSLPADLLPERTVGLGFGIINTLSGLGIALGPYMVGFLRDISGNYLWGFTAMAIFAILGVIPILLLKGQRRQNQVSQV